MRAEEERGLDEGRGSARAVRAHLSSCARRCASDARRARRRRRRARSRSPRRRRTAATSSSPGSTSAPTTRSSRRRTSTSGSSGRCTPPARGSSSSTPDPERIVAAVTPRTRLLALSHVLWTTGAVLPVHELRARPGSRSSSTARSRSASIPVDATRPRLLHDLGAEVALRPGGNRRARRRRPDGAPRRAPQLPLAAAATSTDGIVRAEGRAPRASTRTSPRRAAVAGLRAAIARDPGVGATSVPPRWPSASATRLAEVGRDVVVPEERATLVSWRVPSERVGRRRRAARRGRRHRPRPSRARARARVRRLVDERRRPRAPRRRRL